MWCFIVCTAVLFVHTLCLEDSWYYENDPAAVNLTEIKCTDLDHTGQFTEHHFPLNSVTVYRLREVPNTNWSSIIITLNKLNIDSATGDYLLIGPGIVPFESSPPLYVTKPKPNSRYYVDDTNAYFALASGSTEMNRTFSISWKYTGIKLPEQKTEDPLGVLNSTEICFRNVSEAFIEFEKPGDQKFRSFRGEFINYIKDRSEGKFTKALYFQNLNYSHVTMNRLGNNPNSTILYARIQVKFRGKSLLSWKNLEDLIKSFLAENKSLSIEEFGIQQCRKDDLPTQKWGIFIYATAVVFALFILIIWAWKQKVFQQNCTSPPLKEEKHLLSPQLSNMTAEPNLYERTTPKVCEVDEHGRRQTLIQQSSFQTNVKGRYPGSRRIQTTDVDDGNHNEISMTDMNTNLSVTEEPASARHVFGNTRSKQRPSIQSLIQNTAETDRGSPVSKTGLNETDHFYDSVCNDIKETETKL